MKTTDLWIPCSFENRKPVLLEQFLYVPDLYDKHGDFQIPPFFSSHEPIRVEYCSGNGQWICQKAIENPRINWIAVEKKFVRARKIWLKMKKQNLKNLFIVYGEAFVFTKHYLKEASIEKAYINFPDPWPKRKAAKHRLVQKKFTDELFKILSKKGSITLVTDDAAYRDQINHVFNEPRWKENPPSIFILSDFGDSYFASLWKSKGRDIYYMQYTKENR